MEDGVCTSCGEDTMVCPDCANCNDCGCECGDSGAEEEAPEED